MWHRMKRGPVLAIILWGSALSLITLAEILGNPAVNQPATLCFAATPGEGSSPPVPAGEYDVDLQTEDFVPVQRTAPTDTKAINYQSYNGSATDTANGKGNPDNSVPMTVVCTSQFPDLPAPTIVLTATAAKSGQLTIKPDTVVVPLGKDKGVTVMLYGVKPCTAINDITIEARIAGEVRASKKITVIGVAKDEMRTASDNPGAAWVGKYGYSGIQKVLELHFYPLTIVGIGVRDVAITSVEHEFQFLPDKPFPKLEFNVPRYRTTVAWEHNPERTPQDTTPEPPQGSWVFDGSNGGVEGKDLNAQTNGNNGVLRFDSPSGGWKFPVPDGCTATWKKKFTEWLEVKIGSKWYILSQPQLWHAIGHVKFDTASGHWQFVPDTKDKVNNEVRKDASEDQCPLKGFSDGWKND